MTYEVVTFVGDFPVAHQPNWDIKFDKLEDAVVACSSQHEHFKKQENDEHYTVIIDLSKSDEDDIVFMLCKSVAYHGLKAQEYADMLGYGECP